MAAGWKQFGGEMNLIQIPPSAAMCPGRPELPQHTSLETHTLCTTPPPPSSPTSKLSSMLSCHSRPACHILLALDVSVFVCIRNVMFEERSVVGVNHLADRE